VKNMRIVLPVPFFFSLDNCILIKNFSLVLILKIPSLLNKLKFNKINKLLLFFYIFILFS